jgi:AraC-like DNA-binding protein
MSSQAPLSNWSNLRLILDWAYKGKPSSHGGSYLGHPCAAWLITAGSVTITYDSQRETYEAGKWIFPRASNGVQQFSKNAELLSIRFEAEWPTGEPLFDRTRSLSIDASLASDLTAKSERLIRVIQREFKGSPIKLQMMQASLHQHLVYQRYLYEWFVAYARVMKTLGLHPSSIGELDTRVRDGIARLEAQPLNTLFREADLAKNLRLSISQMNKLFCRCIGRTPKAYWENRRIKSAQMVLLGSTRSIKSIAFDLGFNSPSHFSVWAKRHLGASPKAIREDHVASIKAHPPNAIVGHN